MIEISPNLFIGNQNDYEYEVKFASDWKVVHACKEPYHRNALGYTGRAASKTHPEYLIAKREGRLILNLIDADEHRYIPEEIIDASLKYIHENIKNHKLLVHCNQGMSRSPTIGLLYLANQGIINKASYHEALNDFKRIYPAFNPAQGMQDFARLNWEYYQNLEL